MYRYARVEYKDSANLDAFSRLRISDPLTQLDWTNQYAPASYADQQIWDVATSGGSVTARNSESAIRLSTGGTADGNHATVQTKQAILYQPGKSRLVFMTFAMGTAVTNGVAEIGYGNADDGIFLQRSGTALNIIRRTSSSGSVVDNIVAQADWNCDPMDGTGESKIDLDFTKTQILVIDLQFLGVGRVRVGFDVDGKIVYAQEFRNANNLSTVYMSSGSLPLRIRVENDGTATGTLTLDSICVSVISEGGYESASFPQFGASNEVTGVATSTTLLPLLSLRPKTAFNTGRWCGHIVPQSYGLAVESRIHEYQLIKNATLSTSASFVDVNSTFSAAQVDVGSTSVTGGIIVDCGYLSAGGNVRGTGLAEIFSRLPIVYTSLNDVQETLTLATRTVTATGNAYGNITWQEQF